MESYQKPHLSKNAKIAFKTVPKNKLESLNTCSFIAVIAVIGNGVNCLVLIKILVVDNFSG